MVRIDSSEYGYIIIDGKKYPHDVYILPSGKVEEREHSHTFSKEQVEHVLKEKPDVVIIGKGTSGMASLSDDAKELLEKSKVEVIKDWTPKIRERFNESAKKKRVTAIIHTTC